MSRRALAMLFALGGWIASAQQAAAEAVFTIQNLDDPGEGFNDPQPVSPIGGNSATTLGAQRLRALQYAADLWGQALDSDVPIVIGARFEAQGCGANGTTLAYAGAESLETGVDADGGDPDLTYPAALADRLMGEDLSPGEPDISATFNSDVDRCFPGGFYYGLDAKHGEAVDMVNVASHEIGHGLGMHEYVDPTNGTFLLGKPSAYAAHVLDIETGKRWDAMSNGERLASLVNARKVVWDGERVRAQAQDLLASGNPAVSATPPIAGLSGLAGDASFGAAGASIAVDGPLATAPDGCPLNGVTGRIALLHGGCAHSAWAAAVEANGAIGVLLAVPWGWSTPPPSLEEVPAEPVGIPVLVVSEDDAALLGAAAAMGPLNVALAYEGESPRGADALGRMLLNATDPATSSSIAHWDSLARPNLLLEPFENPHAEHTLDLTPALLQDLGWQPFCGNGRLDREEQCDEGEDNDDTAPDACRTDCRAPACGDGVVDGDEACDDASDNSDERPDACRSDCRAAHCGDGVIDRGEACDDGADNSASAADACRPDCARAHCGDGVVDRGEQCDSGAERSDSRPDACRLACRSAACGDGVVDSDEACDDGARNADDRPDACREDCRAPRCGDGVVDTDEQCDDGPRNADDRPDACRRDCRSARCGDGVIDTAEGCERALDPSCPLDCRLGQAAPQAGASGAGPAAAEAGAGRDSGGCDCRVGGRNRPNGLLAGLALGAVVCARVCRRRAVSRAI